MSIVAQVPKGGAAQKPPHGAPCNRCGLCCMATLCPLAMHVFKRGVQGPCPALMMEAGGSSCGLVKDPGKFNLRVVLEHGDTAAGLAAGYLVGAGTGCDARLEGEPADKEFYARLVRRDRRVKSAVNRAKKIWRISP